MYTIILLYYCTIFMYGHGIILMLFILLIDFSYAWVKGCHKLGVIFSSFWSSCHMTSFPFFDTSFARCDNAILTKQLSGWPEHTVHRFMFDKRLSSEFSSSMFGMLDNGGDFLPSIWCP